ncbi:MAG: aminopeptidase P family protein [Chloroflexi bacterium]|nr:aminopeptidase P family protein [Chloroflexota bacterium]
MDRREAVTGRIKRVSTRLAHDGLDAGLFYSDGHHSILGADSAFWVSGMKPMGPHTLAIVTADGDARLVVSPFWEEERAREQSPIERIVAADGFDRGVEQAIRELGLQKARTGLVGRRRLTAAAQRAVHSALDTPPQSFDDAFDELARRKDAYELGLARHAACIAEAAHDYMLEVARVGMTEWELAAEIVHFSKSQGADDNFLLMASSQHNSGVRPPMDRRLDVGDFIIMEITPGVHGQYVQICRTAHVGDPTTAESAAYEANVAAMQAGIAHGRPGLRVKDVVAPIDQALTAAGYGRWVTGHRRGHGFGIGCPSPGDIARDNETVLEPGMLFVVHPNQYLPETGYVLAGEPVVVGESGLELLTTRIATLDVIAA